MGTLSFVSRDKGFCTTSSAGAMKKTFPLLLLLVLCTAVTMQSVRLVQPNEPVRIDSSNMVCFPVSTNQKRIDPIFNLLREGRSGRNEYDSLFNLLRTTK